ncbi:hypothetical protein GYA19_01945 [Candidatus Beckwithbacteria bacterium]|nr:hypothetical protein [Candidatus Beckwithbacteria bacterium]
MTSEAKEKTIKMIDTIALTLKQGSFTILDHDKFSPSTRGLYDASAGYYRLGSRSNITCKQNPTRSELKSGIRKPRLTVVKRINQKKEFEIALRIELSIPKFIYGNSFDELTDDLFPDIVQKLKATLYEMGVYVYETHLANAYVSLVHFSKNIVLTDYTTPYLYLEQLKKLNINKRLDTNRTDFRNEGHSFKYRANYFEVVFYDKLKDLKQAKLSEKRAEEKDNSSQLNLLSVLEKIKPFEVLRMEVRLNRRQEIRQILKKIKVDLEPTFKNIFSQEISKKVLLYYLSEIESGYPPLLIYEYETPKKFFNEFLLDNPSIKLSTALKMLGMRVLLDETGVREFREMAKRYGNYAWYTLNKEMKNLHNIKRGVVIFQNLRNELIKFKPLKLVDFQDKMLNNDKYD